MVDVLSPLKTKTKAGRHGAAGDTGVTLGIRSIEGLWQLAGWSGFETAAEPILKRLGLEDAGTFREARRTDHATAWRIAPDKILLETARGLGDQQSADLAVLDLGHARAAITLNGPAARDLLSQLIAIDVSTAAFRPGEFIQTGIHHIGVLIHCLEADRFDILVPGTWAESVWEVLFDNALPHGVEVREAP
ncbi:sarcosine oxidase subunit gamma [Roseibium sp. SCP14]|uniref:sarcosine oxidase subunit gamma n=1 Tax=Roseibium sp. SCP14 TaxID=3141375 RepID=UPI003334D5BF